MINTKHLLLRILCVVILLSTTCDAFGQLNCQKIQTDQGTEVSCYHKNKKVSTIEFWDKEKRSGKITGFNSNGEKLFSYSLRTFAGHASVRLWYYPNGQVSKVEYNSHPDAGIQFWNYITEFDESGKQTKYSDYSRPDGNFIPGVIKETTPAKEYVKYSVSYTTSFVVINETKYSAAIQIRPSYDKLGRIKKDTIVYLEPKQRLSLDSLSASIFMNENTYWITLMPKQPKGRRFKIITAQPITEVRNRTFTWHILQE